MMGIRKTASTGRSKGAEGDGRCDSEAGLRQAREREIEIRRDGGRRPLFRRRNRLLRFGRL
ncbi:MAG TPA: hypothetical protein VM778_05620 [Gemmatimonadota bacterium]|nr:hypothetical protein [Gemmatimonadota bacterium]